MSSVSKGRLVLLSNGSATGSYYVWPGGRGTFSAAGTFGGATVKLQFKGPDGSTALDAGPYTTLTAVGGGNFDLPPCEIRVNVSGGTPSALYVDAVHLGL